MRVWRYMLIVAALALLGCEEANNNIPDNGEGNNTGNEEVEEPAFEVEFKHIGWYDIEAEITPPEGVVEYGCGVVESSKVRDLGRHEIIIQFAHDDACHKRLYNKDIYNGYGYLDDHEYSLVCHYWVEGENEQKIYIHEFKTEAAPEAKNGITDIELFGPYLREDILALDPSISEVIESDGAWYFYRITTQNDNIAKIYSYPTYQVAMMDAAYASLFMLVMQRSWMVENSYFCHPFNSNLCVFAMVEDGDGVMSDIAMSNILNYNDQARDAQEFVDHYYAEHSAE